MNSSAFVICEHCEAVWRRPALGEGEVASCERCGAGLGGKPLLNLDAALALTLAGLVAFLLATTEPILRLEAGGFRNEVSLWSMILSVWDQGFSPLSVACAIAVFFLPLMQLLLFTHVLVPLRQGHRAQSFPLVMHALHVMRPWSMVEVFMLGILVSMTKLRDTADIVMGVGIGALFVLTLVLTLLSTVELERIWEHADSL